MAIVRRRTFLTSASINPNDVALIDTPEKLLNFARHKDLYTLPLDVQQIAETLGIPIEYVNFSADKSDISGKLLFNDSTEKWVIQVNAQHHLNRQRYTIAHELGHYFLHRHLKHEFEDKIFFRGGGDMSKEEWQANTFASALLMPEDEMFEAVRSGINEIEDLAHRFQVSTLALRLRAKNLGMAGHGI